MSTALPGHSHGLIKAPQAVSRIAGEPVRQAFWLLRIGFTVAPILFGLDKFFHLLVDWDIYMAPRLADVIPGTVHQSMYAVGVIEVVAGLVVALKPRYGALVVAAWLAGIIVNLLLLGDSTTLLCATSDCASLP